jgi:hypothetical protein
MLCKAALAAFSSLLVLTWVCSTSHANLLDVGDFAVIFRNYDGWNERPKRSAEG